jgi:hypothetical protein
MVVACLALLVALGGASFAAVPVLVPKNSVGTAELKNEAVTGLKVKDGSLAKKDFKVGQLPAGPAGPAGPQGSAGPAGAAGLLGWERIEGRREYTTPFQTDPGSLRAEANCSSGKKVLGGFGHVQHYNAGGFLRSGQIAAIQGPGSLVTVYAVPPPAGVTRIAVNAWAICATAPTTP